MQEKDSKQLDRFELLHVVLDELFTWYTRLDTIDFITIWNEKLAFRNEWVKIRQEGYPQRLMGEEKEFEAQVLGLTPEGFLRVRKSSQKIVNLQMGEISIRPG